MTRILLGAVLAFGVGSSALALDHETPTLAQRAPCSTLARCRAALTRSRDAVHWQRHERRRLVRELRRERLRLGRAPSPGYALRLAAAFTGAPLSILLCIASGETGGTFDPNAYNRSGAAGLFQFEPGTWASLGVPGFSAFDPLAAALAAARQIANGDVAPWRGGEEGCWS
jgi:hypothetical protein